MPRGQLPVGRPDRDIQTWRYLMTRRFKECVSVDDLDDIIHDAVERAKNGDAQARQFIADYTLVKPKATENEASDFKIGGDLNLVLNQLSIEQLQVLAGLNDKLSPTITDRPLSIPEPGLQDAAGRGESEAGPTPPADLLPADEPPF